MEIRKKVKIKSVMDITDLIIATIKERNIKPSKIEKCIYTSPGYISRLKKNNNIINTQILFQILNILEIEMILEKGEGKININGINDFLQLIKSQYEYIVDFERSTGISSSIISRWNSGICNPRLDNLITSLHVMGYQIYLEESSQEKVANTNCCIIPISVEEAVETILQKATIEESYEIIEKILNKINNEKISK